MKIYQIFSENALRNFTYLLAWEGRAICLDPFDAQQVIQVLEKDSLKLEVIINTHEHWDHHHGNHDLINYSQAEVWTHPMAAKIIPQTKRSLQKGEKIQLNHQFSLDVLDLPGHTMAHLGLLLKEGDRIIGIFTGDTLFNAGVGNCRSKGNPENLFTTIQDVFSPLAEDVLIYPGHEYREKNLLFTLSIEEENFWAKDLLEKHRLDLPSKSFSISNMGEERKINTFLRLHEESVKRGITKNGASSKEIFLALRNLRDTW